MVGSELANDRCDARNNETQSGFYAIIGVLLDIMKIRDCREYG